MTNDPDLDGAIVALRYDARKIRDGQRQLARLDPVRDYLTIAARRFELFELEEAFRVKGEKLCIDKDRGIAGRALMLFVEQADDLLTIRKKRPSPRELAHAIRTVSDAAERDRSEAEAAEVLAQQAKVAAAFRAAAGSAALAYMEASR